MQIGFQTIACWTGRHMRKCKCYVMPSAISPDRPTWGSNIIVLTVKRNVMKCDRIGNYWFIHIIHIYSHLYSKKIKKEKLARIDIF